MKNVTFNLQMHISPYSKSNPLKKTRKGLITPFARNVKHGYADFNEGFFKDNSLGNKFAKIWNQNTKKYLHSVNLTANKGVRAVLNSYFNWPAKYTRHHKEKITAILNILHKDFNITELQLYIEKLFNDAKEDVSIKKTGHYYQMLDFINTRVKNLSEISHLTDITFYLSTRKIPSR